MTAIADNTVVLKILQDARALISKPERWTQGAFARTVDGISVHAWSNHATRFDAVGALMRSIDYAIGKQNHILLVNNAVNALRAVMFIGDVGCKHPVEAMFAYNDTHSHAYVLALFDSAIARFASVIDQLQQS